MRWPLVRTSHYEKATGNAEYALDQLVDTRIVNDRLTDANLAVARRLTRALRACARYRAALAAYGDRRTVPDVLEEHDVHRKALADALGDQKRHLNWDQLIAEVARVNKAAGEWMTESQAHATRADRLQRRLDDCLGLNTSQVEDGRLWQHTRIDKKGGLS